MASLRLRFRRFVLNKLMHADDTPHAIALGVGIAVLVAFLPLVGIQTIVAIGIAALVGANNAVCIPIVWITNPATFLPIYIACLKIGQFFMPGTGDSAISDVERLKALSESGSVFKMEFWRQSAELVLSLAAELWIGCGIVGVTLGVASYLLARWSVTTYREKRRLRMLRRELYRASFAKNKVASRSKAV